jgi:hypothetical protein
VKKLFLLLMTLFSPLCFADVYKCTVDTKTTYQDKPCPISQNQTVIPQTTHKANVQAVSSNNHVIRIERDAHGRIKRSHKAKQVFKATNPCPANGQRSGSCPGYVIDHINPLACGGADSPDNMQWQTIEDGKTKDSWERNNCNRQSLHHST